MRRNAPVIDADRSGQQRPIADDVDHFFVMTGKVWDDARVAGIRLRVVLTDGRMVEGVPENTAVGSGPDVSPELDDGYPRYVLLQDDSVDLADIRELTIVRPGEPG